MGKSCGKFLWEHHTGNSCGKILQDKRRGKSQFKKFSDWWKFSIWNRVMGSQPIRMQPRKSCGKILAGKSCRKILQENLAGNSCGKILSENLAGNLLQENLAGNLLLENLTATVIFKFCLRTCTTWEGMSGFICNE